MFVGLGAGIILFTHVYGANSGLGKTSMNQMDIILTPQESIQSSRNRWIVN